MNRRSVAAVFLALVLCLAWAGAGTEPEKKEEKRDDKNRITEIRYLGADGELCLNQEGYARVTMAYTSFGALRRLSYFGTGKKRVLVPSLDYAAIECDYRGKTLTGRRYLDAEGKPAESFLGYAAMIQKVNKKNQVLGISYQHADGSPAVCPEGWSSCEIRRDKSGRETAIRYLDAAGNPVTLAEGYAREEISYPKESEKRIRRFDAAGNAVAFETGVYTLVQQLREGRVVRETFLGADGAPTVNGGGASALVYAYDQDGNITDMTEER